MKPLQWLLSLAFIAAFCFVRVHADSESGSESNESNEKKHSKKHNYNPSPSPAGTYHYNQPAYMPPPPPPPAGAYHYNQPAYMPPPPPPPYGSYYPSPMPYYYGYPPPAPQQQPAFGANPYPYGGYYNQAPPPPPPPGYQPQSTNQVPQEYPGIPGGISTINHSLKVNKEYKEDGHHYRPDGISSE